MLDNKTLFFECLSIPAKNVDPYIHKILNKEVISPNNVFTNELLGKNAMLIDLITKYNNYNVNNDKSHNKEIIENIDECLKCEYMNYSPFSQYLMAHDITYKMYLYSLTYEEKEYILDCYIKDRHALYLNKNYSEIIFQVIADNYSHKRKGKLGVKKLEKIFEEYNLKKIECIEEINNDKYYILPDLDGKILFKEILKNNKIEFKFEKNHQGKLPDALIKINNKFIIIEHKTSKELGGGQDKQMTEIIDFIGYGEREVHYISFLDGVLFNELKEPKETNKLYRDKQNIINNLEDNPYNYFVNEYGFKKILDYFRIKINK